MSSKQTVAGLPGGPQLARRARPETTDHPIGARPSRLPRHFIGFERAEPGCVSGPILKLPDGDVCNLTEIALRDFQSPDPSMRWAALRTAVMSSTIRAAAAGADPAETEMMLALLHLLDEMTEGNFTNPMLPKAKSGGKGRRATSFDAARTEAYLMLCAEVARELDNIDLEEACSKALKDVDRVAKNNGAKIADAWAPYSAIHRQTKVTSNRHPLTSRLAGWIKDVPTFSDTSQAAHDLRELRSLADQLRATYGRAGLTRFYSIMVDRAAEAIVSATRIGIEPSKKI